MHGKIRRERRSRGRMVAGIAMTRSCVGLAVLAAGLTAVAAPARAADLPVSHTVRQLTVPGTAQGEPRAVDVHLWYPTTAAEAAARPKTVYRSALHGRPLGTDLWSPLSWTVEAEIAGPAARVPVPRRAGRSVLADRRPDQHGRSRQGHLRGARRRARLVRRPRGRGL